MTDIDIPAADDADLLSALEAAFGPEALALIADDGMESDTDAAPMGLIELVDAIDADDPTTAVAAAPARAVDWELDRYLFFQLRDTMFAVSLPNVLEIQRLPAVTPIPRVPRWLCGVTNLRGSIVSVVDLSLLLEIPPTESAGAPRLVVFQSVIEEITVGMKVDNVIGIRLMNQRAIHPPLAPLQGTIAPFVQGLANLEGQAIALLDMEKLLACDNLRQFETN